MRDYSVNKVKRIMANRSAFVCRACGLSHSQYLDAQNCCKKPAPRFNKNAFTFRAVYDKLRGGD